MLNYEIKNKQILEAVKEELKIRGVKPSATEENNGSTWEIIIAPSIESHCDEETIAKIIANAIIHHQEQSPKDDDKIYGYRVISTPSTTTSKIISVDDKSSDIDQPYIFIKKKNSDPNKSDFLIHRLQTPYTIDHPPTKQTEESNKANLYFVILSALGLPQKKCSPFRFIFKLKQTLKKSKKASESV